MAKARRSATMDAPSKATLDVMSMEHPALTPLTWRREKIRIISLRKANKREETRYASAQA